MKLNERWQPRIKTIVDAVLTKNIVLVQAVGLCPILAAGVTLQNGVVLTVCTALVLLSCGALMALAGDKLPTFLRPIVYTLTASALLVGASFVLDRYLSHELYTKLYIFIPLMAVNVMLTTRAGGAPLSARVTASLVDAVGVSLGFGAVICIVSVLREITATNTVWGKTLPIELDMPEVSYPFAAYILLGFMAAGLQTVLSAYHRKREGGTRS